MFVAGLSEEQATKTGFAEFCSENLQITATESDIKEIFKIPSEREQLFKFIFRSAEIREKYYSARHLLKTHRTIWFRDDLITKRELLAKHLRELVKGNHLKKTWADHGNILIIRNGEEKPSRITNISKL